MSGYQVEPNDPLPRYYQVYASLQSRILAGEFGRDGALPSERQLVSDYGVSRITVVKALDLLERDRLIDRQHGRGNFVVDRSEAPACPAECRVLFCIPAFADSYLTAVLIGVTRTAMQHGIQVQIIGADRSGEEVQLIERGIDAGAHGLIIFPRYPYPDAAFYRSLWEKRFPLVMVDRYYPALQTDAVVFEDEAAAYALTETLISQGHQRIELFVGHEVAVTSVYNRMRGYQRALEAHGIPYDEELVCLDVYEDLSPESLDRLQASYINLRERLKQDRPTALLAINNPVAAQMGLDLMRIRAQKMEAIIAGNAGEADDDLPVAVAAISHKYISFDQNTPVALAIQSGEALGERAMELLVGRIQRTLPDGPQLISVPMEIVYSGQQELS